jgi:hypothetical protein
VHCVSCHHPVEPGGRYCNYCGAPLRPSPWRPTARLLVGAGLVAVLVVASLQVYRGLERDRELREAASLTSGTTTTQVTVTTSSAAPAPTPPPTPVPPTNPAPTVAPVSVIKAGTIEASRPTAPYTNVCGEAFPFDASFLQDGDFSTAWRVKGDGVGRQIRLRLAAPTLITEVGMVPGWDKIDGCDGGDLFRQHRTVAKVRWIFDGGQVVEQELSPERTLQVLPVSVTTRNVIMQIMATNAPDGIDMMAISEVRLGGTPTA